MSQEQSSKRPVMVMAGGTGGHVFPGLAVAREIMDRGIPVVWLGTRRGLEAKIVPANGIPIEWLSVSGLRGKKISKLFTAPFMLFWSGLQALWIMLRIRPRVVIGMGGFVTGPGGIAAKLTFKPICIQEQNAVAGFTNRVLAKLAKKICQAFPNSFPAGRKVEVTGNPVRADIVAITPPEQRLANRTDRLRVLVLGGSLGAQAINATLPKAMAMLDEAEMPEVRHQAGERNLVQAQGYYAEINNAQVNERVALTAFIDDMAEAYAWADLVICRSGALTVSELTATGVGAILVPFPYAVDDHQTANARFFTEAGAGELIPQNELTAEGLAQRLRELGQDRARLMQMAKAARSLAIPDSAKRVADICLSLSKVK